jgi:hypothetical protein
MEQLNQTDIQNLMAIVDMSTQRGVFKAADLAPVGQLYEKLKRVNESMSQPEEKKDS